jgi:hypothetical protein
MNVENQELKKTIMRRVYAVAFLKRTLFRPVFMKAGVLVILMVSTFFVVSVPNVINNILVGKRFDEQVFSFMQAFLGTEMVVKVIILLGFLVCFGLVSDIVKTFLPNSKKHAY